MSESQTQIGFIEQSETFSRIQPDIGAMEKGAIIQLFFQLQFLESEIHVIINLKTNIA